MKQIYFLVQFSHHFAKYLALKVTLIRDQDLINVGAYESLDCFFTEFH